MKHILMKSYRYFEYSIKSMLRIINKNPNYADEASSFVNTNNFSSSTDFFIWVDTKNFKTNIFQGSVNNWTLIKSYLCSIGKPSTPTIKGNFKVGIKGISFGAEHGYKVWYYTQIYRNYLFHSILYNLNGTVKDARLGMAISNGCIRLAKDNAKWIYDNIPPKTSIHIS